MQIDDLLGMQMVAYRKAGLTFQEIAERTGLSKTTCFRFLRPWEIKLQPKRPGCENCKTKPHALSYCLKCYRRHRRLNGLN